MKKFFALLLFISLPIYSFAGNNTIIQTTAVWTTPSSHSSLFTNSVHTAVWNYNGSTYFVWVDANLRPMITKMTNGQENTAPIDDDAAYTALADGHNRFSLGIDKNGYIHITGDMHNYGNTTIMQSSTKPYPTRYQKQAILYWVSNKPESVTSGFSFVGGNNASTALPGTGWSYGRFFVDNNNELYYSSRVKAIAGAHTSGEMGLGLYRYDANLKTWSALGDKAEDTRVGTYYKVMLWENAGMAPGQWYQGFMSDFKFDTANRLHMAASINSDNNLTGNNRIIYAVSNDGGATWYRANGTKISKLPVRAIDGLPNTGDVVATVTTAPFFDSRTKVIADKNGRPGIANFDRWFIWNGTEWQRSENLMPSNTADISRNQQLVLTANNWSKMFFADTLQDKIQGYDFSDFNLYESLDASLLKSTGEIYGIGVNKTTNLQTILKTIIKPAPLPSGWDNKDISYEHTMFGGNAGFANKEFVLTNYGISLDNPHDSFHYVYKKMTGDGVLTARVVSLTDTGGNARLGIMMRETLAYNSKHVMALLNPPKMKAIFGYRKVAGDYTTNLWTLDIPSPYWLRLERNADVFTGFISKDGQTWTKTGTVTLPMSTEIYIGLVGASYNRTGMQTAVFDNVSAPVELKK